MKPLPLLILGGLGLFLIALLCFAYKSIAIENELTQQANQALASNGFKSVTAIANGQIITLKGSLLSDKNRQRAESITRHIHGVTEVNNQLTITPIKHKTQVHQASPPINSNKKSNNTTVVDTSVDKPSQENEIKGVWPVASDIVTFPANNKSTHVNPPTPTPLLHNNSSNSPNMPVWTGQHQGFNMPFWGNSTPPWSNNGFNMPTPWQSNRFNRPWNNFPMPPWGNNRFMPWGNQRYMPFGYSPTTPYTTMPSLPTITEMPTTPFETLTPPSSYP